MVSTMSSTEPPIRLAGRALKETRHVCAFFRSREEQNKVLMPFFKDGIDRGEKVVHVVDARLHDEHLSACRNGGIEGATAQTGGQFELLHWEDVYLKDGCFDSDRMIELLTDTVQANRSKYKLTRLMGNMEWALEAAPGVVDIIEYEAKLNYVMPKHPDFCICVYDLNRHSGSIVMDIVRTHPMVIINGQLQENSLYMPPDEFLEELKQRRARRQPQLLEREKTARNH